MACASWLMNLGFAAGTAEIVAALRVRRFVAPDDTMVRRTSSGDERVRRQDRDVQVQDI